MKKIIFTLCLLLFVGLMVLGQNPANGLVLKPIGNVGGTGQNVDDRWNSIDPLTDSKYELQLVDAENSLYKVSLTLNKYYRTSKWVSSAKDGDTPNEVGIGYGSWSEYYDYQVVYKDEYSSPANSTARTGFRVPADGTTVTFYAKIVGTQIRSVCDAQEFRFGANEAGGDQGNLLSSIGQPYTSKGIDASTQANANITAERCATSYKALENGANSDFGGKFAIRTAGVQGRGILTLLYPSISFSAEKSIDEIQSPVLNVSAFGNDWDLTSLGTSLGTITQDSEKNISFNGSLKTVVTQTSYPLTQAVSETKVDVDLCYQIILNGSSDEPVTLRKSLALENGATNLNGDWTLSSVNLLEGHPIAIGTYRLLFWFESKYKGVYGEDIITYDNAGSAFETSFVNNFLTGISSPAVDDVKISVDGKTINVISDKVVNIKLYSISGRLITQQVIKGDFVKSLESGAYIIQIDNKSHKLIVE